MFIFFDFIYNIFFKKKNNLLQKEDNTCNVYCIARLLNKSIQEVLEELTKEKVLTKKGCSYKKLQEFFNKKGIKYIFKYKDYIPKCKKILIVEVEKKCNWGHSIYVDEKDYFYNSLEKYIYKNDYNNYKILYSFNFIEL